MHFEQFLVDLRSRPSTTGLTDKMLTIYYQIMYKGLLERLVSANLSRVMIVMYRAGLASSFHRHDVGLDNVRS